MNLLELRLVELVEQVGLVGLGPEQGQGRLAKKIKILLSFNTIGTFFNRFFENMFGYF